MPSKIDVSIAFFGKPYQTIVTIKTLLRYSSQHIDKIYLTHERSQPHQDYSGIFKVIDYFRNSGISLVVHKPRYFVSVGVYDYERALNSAPFRQSIMFQYPLEKTDKKYLCVMHNDMFFYGDLIGEMLERIKKGPANLAGIGSIGQCWGCPAGPAWGAKCNSEKYREFVPAAEEALALTASFNTPRQALQMEVIRGGRVHPMPECRLNEYCALIDVEIYRRETIPAGDIGCYGGSWKGVDLGTVWTHDMYRRGYIFEHIPLESCVKHAPFDASGSGTQSYTRETTYWASEMNARRYIEQEYGPFKSSYRVKTGTARDWVGRMIRRTGGQVLQKLKTLTGKR